MPTENLIKYYTFRLSVSVDEAAFSLNMSKSTFYRYQDIPEFPKVRKFKGKSSVRISDLERWNEKGSEVAQ